MNGSCNNSPPSGKFLILASTNRNKFFEIRTALGQTGILLCSLGDFPDVPEPEETGKTFAENAHLKADYYLQQFQQPVLAEDSGLVVPALDGFPGVRSARIAPDDAARNQLVLERLREYAGQHDANNPSFRSAYYVCSMVYASESGVHEVEGRCEGMIVEQPDGDLGFGYDPIFLPDGARKTFGHMSIKEKSQYSHRGKAVQLMLPHLLREFR